MKTRRGLLIGLGILASLSMTVPVAAANVEQTVISSVEGQQDSTVEENLPEGEETEGENETGAPEEEQKEFWHFGDKSEGFQLYVKDEQQGEVASEATGAFLIGEKIYYLEKGRPQSGIVEVGEAQNGGKLTPAAQLEVGKKYFFEENAEEPGQYGAWITNETQTDQWNHRTDGTWVCLSPGGAVNQNVNGWQEVETGRWLYAENGVGSIRNGWQQLDNKWYYLDEEGKRDTGKTGLQTIENEKYFLNADGVPQTDFQKVDGQTYYFGKDGVLQKYTGWKTIDGKLYYFNNSYQLANSGLNGWQQIDGKWYWMENGKTASGWRAINGKWYYLDEKTGVMQTGFFKDAGGSLYHSDGSGAMTGGGWNLIGNTWYWMHDNGVIFRGWLRQGNTWYYLDEATGAMKTGWYQVGNTWYYSDGSGAMQTGWILPNGRTWYYLNGNGAMAVGWGRVGNTWYYFNESGAMQTGWQQVDGTWYYMSGNGAMQTGWLKLGISWYYLGENGAMRTGWQRLGNTWYYLTPGHGAMKTGWYQVDETWYYSDGSGAMAANRWIDTYYYVGANGAMATNTWVGPYWVGADGRWRPNYDPDLTGAKWVQSGSKWYYQREDGTYLKNMWKKISGDWYRFDTEGAMLTGWNWVDGYKYYFDEKGHMVQDVDAILGKQKEYYITVDRIKCQVMIYAKAEDGRFVIPVKSFACSVGLPSTPTPKGEHHIFNRQRWQELMGPSYGQYCSQITTTGIWLHSVAGNNMTSYNLSAAAYNMLGQPASHGCIRLTVRDAKWIYDNCEWGTKVYVGDYLDNKFDKPATIKIPAGQNWDPTDPNI